MRRRRDIAFLMTPVRAFTLREYSDGTYDVKEELHKGSTSVMCMSREEAEYFLQGDHVRRVVSKWESIPTQSAPGDLTDAEDWDAWVELQEMSRAPEWHIWHVQMLYPVNFPITGPPTDHRVPEYGIVIHTHTYERGPHAELSGRAEIMSDAIHQAVAALREFLGEDAPPYTPREAQELLRREGGKQEGRGV